MRTLRRCFPFSQHGNKRLQKASGGQRPLVSEQARHLQGGGDEAPPGVGKGAGQSQEVCLYKKRKRGKRCPFQKI